MANISTEEQIKKFWEHWGFKFIYQGQCEIGGKPTPYGHWEYMGEWREKLPPIDLNNLFLYAVPKLREIGCRCMLSDKSDDDIECIEGECYMGRVYGRQTQGFIDEYDEDPALALFWAIYKVTEQ